MQAVAFKDKRRGSSGNKEAADDPNYENITFTFKNQNQPKGSHSPPKNKVPAESRPPSDTAQEHHWLPKAMMSLNTFLTLSCMVLLALVLVKNFQMSRELVVLKEALSNVPRRAEDSVGRCEAERHGGQAEPGHHQEKHPRWERETEAAGYSPKHGRSQENITGNRQYAEDVKTKSHTLMHEKISALAAPWRKDSTP